MRICLDNMVMNFLKYQSILLYKEKNPVINKLTRVGNQFFCNEQNQCLHNDQAGFIHAYICMCAYTY